MTAAPDLRSSAAAIVTRTRAAQGLPSKLDDTATAAVAALWPARDEAPGRSTRGPHRSAAPNATTAAAKQRKVRDEG